ncbi:MAG: hypothetical protein LBN95_07665 [Prevotellaceae bacterium]|jgi:glycosyltransferase involved in cell wall biosynthesis|nr:hypothetical protein [Prevotellaceae bacterium]
MLERQPKILFFCDPFTPPAFLPRVRYFCDYFQKKGWNITLITENHREQKLLPENINLQLVDYYHFKNGFLFKIEWLFKTVLNLIFDHKGKYFYRKSKKVLKNNDFDLIFCSCTFHSFPLTTAAMAAKKLNLPFFVDLRDVFEQTPLESNHIFVHKIPTFIGKFLTKHYKKINLKRRNKSLKLTNGISSVSKWHSDFLKNYNSNSYTIYNGFDENLFLHEIIKADKFYISYFGNIENENTKNPDVFFKAISNLKNEQKISDNNLCIKFFCDNNSRKTVENSAKKYEIENFVHFENFVTQQTLVSKMNRSAILLIFSNKVGTKGFLGIMTTKFSEYIGCNRPILCTPNNNDELAQTIDLINCGLVSSDVAEVEKFILEKYAEWQKNGYTKSTISPENREKFSRKNGAEMLEKILLSTDYTDLHRIK